MHDINQLPILILAYNRYDKFTRCINTLHRNGARKFFISIDGPRNDSDKQNQRKIYDYCINNNLKSEIIINHFNLNFGCRLGPINGINWFFKNNKYGVILEDDLIVSNECLEIFCYLLQNNINSKKFMSISSFNEYATSNIENLYSMPIWRSWGWASWAHMWNKHIHFSNKIKKYSLWQLYNLLPYQLRSIETVKILKACQLNLMDAWDYEFNFSHIVNSYRSLTLGGINNYVYGFDNSATHTINPESLDIDFNLFNKTKINKLLILESDYKKSRLILKKCGYFYSKNKNIIQISFDFLSSNFCLIFLHIRILKRNIFKYLT